jgi:hypothetical protein
MSYSLTRTRRPPNVVSCMRRISGSCISQLINIRGFRTIQQSATTLTNMEKSNAVSELLWRFEILKASAVEGPFVEASITRRRPLRGGKNHQQQFLTSAHSSH